MTRRGARGNGPAPRPPYAVKDSLVVRPGREVAVPVLANDSDPEGDQIGLVSDGLIMPEGVPGLDAEARTCADAGARAAA